MNYTPNEPPRAMSAAEIEEILPHRYPFALVDKILDYTHGPVGIGKATAWVDGVRAANAELTFVLTDA